MVVEPYLAESGERRRAPAEHLPVPCLEGSVRGIQRVGHGFKLVRRGGRTDEVEDVAVRNDEGVTCEMKVPSGEEIKFEHALEEVPSF